LGFGYGSMYSPYSPYYGYPTVVNVVNTDTRATTHGRRVARTSSLNNSYVDNSRGVRTITDGTNARGRENGRMSTQPNYYDRTWRDNASNFTRSSMSTGTRGSGYGSSSWDNSGWGNSGGRARSSYDPFG